MRVIYKKLPSRRKQCVATIGVFDGIHLGHRFILEKVKKASRVSGLDSLVISFDTPPRQFFSKSSFHNSWRYPKDFPGCLTDRKQKVKLVESLGLKYLWLLKSSQPLFALSPQDFLSYILRYFRIKKLIVGEDFRFGYKGRGDIGQLKKFSGRYGFKVVIVPKKKINQKIASSSLIRNHILKGELGEAEKFLGRNFSLKAKVVRGRGFGLKLGFPTANISACDYVIPSGGVYAAYVILGKEKYLAAVNIGSRPSLRVKKKRIIEAHLIRFHKNILGKTIEIIFLEKLRKEKKFSNFHNLKSAIGKDVFLIASKYSTCR